MRALSSMAKIAVAAALFIPTAATAETGEGEWSSAKPWWVNTNVDVAQYWSSPNQYSGISKHGCSNSGGWWAEDALICAD